MAFIPVPNVAQANVRATLMGKPVENVLHYSNPTFAPWTEAGIATLAQNIATAWAATMLTALVDDYIFLSVLVTDLEVVGSYTYEHIVTPADPGSGVGDPLPANNAICITHRTGLSGKWNRGRTFICGLSDANADGNYLAAASAAYIGGQWAAFMAAMSADDHQLVIVSKRFNKAPRTVGLAHFVTSTGLRNNRIDSQRRRLPK